MLDLVKKIDARMFMKVSESSAYTLTFIDGKHFQVYFDGLVLDCSISIINAREILPSCFDFIFLWLGFSELEFD